MLIWPASRASHRCAMYIPASWAALPGGFFSLHRTAVALLYNSQAQICHAGRRGQQSASASTNTRERHTQLHSVDPKSHAKPHSIAPVAEVEEASGSDSAEQNDDDLDRPDLVFRQTAANDAEDAGAPSEHRVTAEGDEMERDTRAAQPGLVLDEADLDLMDSLNLAGEMPLQIDLAWSVELHLEVWLGCTCVMWGMHSSEAWAGLGSASSAKRGMGRLLALDAAELPPGYCTALLLLHPCWWRCSLLLPDSPTRQPAIMILPRCSRQATRLTLGKWRPRCGRKAAAGRAQVPEEACAQQGPEPRCRHWHACV